jgi:flagellar basal-body rod modification protein FlgD
MASTAVSAAAGNFTALASAAAPAGETKDAEATADRFLKLLVAQMRNQDPLNPLDNAQVTSQMAQINTVSGLERLNQSVLAMNSQFVQLQALQGAALVGRDVLLEGDRVSIADGQGAGAFEIASAADQVKVEILGAGGSVVGSVDLGARAAGRHRFEWDAGAHADAEGLRFRVVATRAGAAVGAQALSIDRVQAVSAGGDTLLLDLQRNGTVPYAAVRTIQ